jgi:hypothetical protein
MSEQSYSTTKKGNTMNTYTENLTLGEFETMHTLAQTITPKAEKYGALLLEMMHLQRPTGDHLIIQTTDRYRAGRLTTHREPGQPTPDLYLTREVIDTAARLIKTTYGARTPAETYVARIDWDLADSTTKRQTATVSLNDGTVLQTGVMEGQAYPPLAGLFARPVISEDKQPAEAFTMKAEPLAGLSKLTTPERTKRGQTEWAVFTPTVEEGRRRAGALLFSTSGAGWSMDYLAQPLATPVDDLAPVVSA